jgi:N6-L-threonylcarbamoyladenine synthase
MSPEARAAHAADVAASYRAAVVEALVSKLLAAARAECVRTVAVAGGVAANSLLRRRVAAEGEGAGFQAVIPPFAYCTDNAAMIASAAFARAGVPFPDYLALDAWASLRLEGTGVRPA